jgi:putative solute:sodium symporter small subunit
MEESKSYDVNFFKPSTPFLKENIRAIVIGLTIWGVMTYGFQILLKIIETPTPEATYVAFQQAAPKLADGTASAEEKVAVANTYLALLGKSAALLKNDILKTAFTSTVYNVLSDAEKETLLAAAADPKANMDFISAALGITDNKAMTAVIPYALIAVTPDKLAMTDPALKPIMDKFFIHNQSVLTDTIVFGFPFHYLYTALILLTSFVIICLVYCQVIDKMMKKYEMESSFE